MGVVQQRERHAITRFLRIERAGCARQFRLICILPLLLVNALGLAQTACVAPQNLRARLLAKPGAQAHADIGNWFADQKKFDCAAKSFETASRLQPASLTYAYLWGLSLSSSGRNAEALAPLQQASRLDQSDLRPYLALGAALDQLHRPAEAQAEWRKALDIDADSAVALDGLSQDLVDQNDYAAVIALLNKPAGGRQRSALQSLNLGVAFAATGRLDESVTVLRDGLNDAPDSLAIADKLAVVLMLQGKENEAYSVFDLALQKHPNDQATQILYLRTLVSSHSEMASQFAAKLLAAYPNQWEVLYLNALVVSGEGDFNRTRDLLRLSVRLNPNYAESQSLLGNTLSKLGDLPGARIHLEKAIALGEKQPEVHYTLSKALQGLGDQTRGREQLRIYQELKDAQSDKTLAAGKAEEADQEIASGDATKAASLYREALLSDPDEPLLHYKLAKVLDKLNDAAGETAELQKAVKLNPNLAEAQTQLGFLAAHSGNLADAETYFRAAVRAQPSYIVAWVNLAATLASESKWQDAKQTVDQALAIDPDNAPARRLREAIASANPGSQ
jgi:tetratricopeptide (TPR) repeat protein